MSNLAKTIIFLILVLFFGFSFAQAQTKILKNIGFAQTSLWYSKDPFFTGDRIRIYTTIINSSKYDFRGNLEFYANRNLLGKSGFSLVSGGFQVLWADWIAEGGQKKIYANITEAKISLPGGMEESVILENAKTGEIETFIDKDTDKDGIGDKSDPKDDRVKEQQQAQSPVSNTNSNTVKSSDGGIVSQLPDSQGTANAIKQSISKINSFLDEQKEKVEAKKEELQKKLREDESLFEFDFGNLLGTKKEDKEEVVIKQDEGENKNFLKLYILALSALIFSLEYKVIIYLFSIYITYRILKFFIKKIFFRSVDNY